MEENQIEATFFCDESGSTGTNWLDPEQPYFVYGGWLVENNALSVIEKNLKELLKEYPSNEVKATKFFSKRNSWKLFDEITESFFENKSIPFFVILDKCLMVALKIVETVFDSAYNSALKPSITWDVNLKKMIGEIIFRDEDLLGKFSCLIKTGTLDLNKMKDITMNMINVFKQYNLFYVVNGLNYLSDEELIEMIGEFEVVSKNGEKRTMLTLTLPGINMLLQNLETYCQDNKLKTGVIHDNLRGYNNEFEEFRKIFLAKKKCNEVDLGKSIFRSSLNSIQFLKFEDSKNNLFIQMADLQCGFINRTFRKIKRKDKLNDSEKTHLEVLFKLHDQKLNWDYIANDEFIIDFKNAISSEQVVSRPINYKEINRQFRQYLK